MPQPDRTAESILRSTRALIAGLVIAIIVLGFALVMITIGVSPGTREAERVDALANSREQCVVCHRRTTPGIVEQYGHSTMALADVLCADCHKVAQDYPGAVEHEGAWVLPSPTTAMCRRCHGAEVAQFYQSRHSAPAYAAMRGVDDFDEAQLAIYRSIPEGSYNPDKTRNALYALEGEEITRFACERCHNIGKPHADGSIGQCQKCHLRHEFSLEQVRKPETCNACHIGPDHPQYEIYQESPHGISYATTGHTWHWTAEVGTLTVSDFPAPQCATCHISGFGATGTTHDVGERLTWYLFAPISERRPAWESNRTRMQFVCRECHNEEWINEFYTNADLAVEKVNGWVRESDDIMTGLKGEGLITEEPFDQPIDFVYFDLWHHWGRTAKFGTWMQGADYVQWHGAYEILHEMAELRDIADDMTSEAEGAGD
jgi:hydroxylamine dehydrogenase